MFTLGTCLSAVSKPPEKPSQILQALKTLAKDCSFQDVSADVYREELTRD